MTPFIITEHPEMSANEAIDESRRIMSGHKFDLFYLFLSFIGWFLLGLLSLGIGFFWIIPYVQAAEVAFYNDIKGGPQPASAQSGPAAPASTPDSFAPSAGTPSTDAPSTGAISAASTAVPSSPDSPSDSQSGQ